MSFYRRTDVTLERLQIRVEVPGLTASFGSDVDSVTTSESEAESVDMVGEQADDLLRSMTRTFQRQVQRHRTQRHPTGALTDGEVVELLTETDVQLEQSRAEHTWEGYASVIHQFRLFDQRQRSPAWRGCAMANKIVAWITWCMNRQEDARVHQRKGIQKTTALTYLKKLRYMYTRSQHHWTKAGEAILEDYQKSLKRSGAENPTDPAIPIKPEQVKRAIEDTESLVARAQILAMWLTASRTSDVQRLTTSDIELQACPGTRGKLLIIFKWRNGTKGSYGTVHDLVEVDRQTAATIRRALDLAGNGGNPFPLGHAAITCVLRRVEPELSSHSIKKGALTILLQHFPPMHVAEKAKHRDTTLLRAYVGATEWARANEAIQMSAELAKII